MSALLWVAVVVILILTDLASRFKVEGRIMASTTVRRKRSLGEVSASAQASASTGDKKRLPYLGNQESSLPLVGVVACLSGLPHDKKEILHQTIDRLGGR